MSISTVNADGLLFGKYVPHIVKRWYHGHGSS
jgi:hypothetical protein